MHFWGEVPEDEVDRENTEIGFLEIGFSSVEEHQLFFLVPPRGTHELGGEILELNGNSPPASLLENIADFDFGGFSAAECRLNGGEAVGAC